MRGQSQSGQGVPRSALGVRRACARRTPFLAPPNSTDLVGFCVPQPSGHNLGLGLLSSVHRQATFSTPGPRCQPGDSVTHTHIGLALHSLLLAHLGNFSLLCMPVVPTSVAGTDPSTGPLCPTDLSRLTLPK